MTKKKILLIFIFLTAAIIFSAFYYFNLIKQNAVLSLKENDIALKYSGISFNELIESSKIKFSELYPTYHKRPYLTEKPNSSIKEEYIIKKLELSLTEIKSYPARMDIAYNYVKTIDINGKIQTETNTDLTEVFLLKKQNGKNKTEWKKATISLWVIPLFYISALVIISITYNFIIAPSYAKMKRSVTK